MVVERTVRALERVSVLSGSITSRALAEVHPEVRSLTLGQYRVLALVAGAPHGQRVKELARRSNSRSAATTKIIRRLEDQGLVWRERGAQPDGRAVVVRLTEAGSRTWSEVSVRRRQLLSDALAAAELAPGSDTTLEAIADALDRYTA